MFALMNQKMRQQISSYGGGQSARHMSGGMAGRPVDDPRIAGIGGMDPGTTAKDRALGLGGGRAEVPLPPDATSTLFVEGLPSNCTQREVARILFFGYRLNTCIHCFLSLLHLFLLLRMADIFRPFVGYKEVRLVSKESRHVSIILSLSLSF